MHVYEHVHEHAYVDEDYDGGIMDVEVRVDDGLNVNDEQNVVVVV